MSFSAGTGQAMALADAPPPGLLGIEDAQASQIDCKAFAFRHGLDRLDLFGTERLLDLAKTTSEQRPADLYYDAGKITADARWNDIPACSFSVTDALERIESADAWIILRNAQLDPHYASILDRCMDDIVQAGGARLANRIRLREAIVFITSPHRVTAYHIDRECGFLMQISGEKEISVFDPGDREVLPEQEIELFWTRDNNAATYRKHLQPRAERFTLTPGAGVHLPINAPHWIQNGPQVSVSININFGVSESERGNIYRANYHLRQIGLKPRPPFDSPFADAIKRPLGALSLAARRSVRHVRSAMRARG